MRQKTPKRRNPVAKALAHAALKNRIVPKRREDRRARDKLRQSLRAYRTSPALFSPESFWADRVTVRGQ